MIRIRGRAFTLVELLIVISIISMLALIALPNFEVAQIRTKVTAVKSNMRMTATKLEMYATETNRYPELFKTRRLMFWDIKLNESEDPETSFVQRMRSMYGPHYDMFEWEVLKRKGLQDVGADDGGFDIPDPPLSDWLANEQGQHIFNGFSYFHLPFSRTVLRRGPWCDLHRVTGDWVLVATGPDLLAETFNCKVCNECGLTYPEEVWDMEGFFTEYDPTNGSVSYGNLFRTQRNPSGLHADAQLNKLLAEVPDYGEGPSGFD